MTLVALLPEPALLSWGWRIPFLASFGLLALGLWFRARIEESPVFVAEAAAGNVTRTGSPILELLRNDGRNVIKSVLVQIGSYSGQGVFGVFIASYAPPLGYSRSVVLLSVMLGTLGSVAATPLYALLSDRVGRRTVLFIGTLANGIVAYPMFLLINSGNTALFMIAVIAYLTLVMTPVTAVAPVLLSELFGTTVRYTGVSTSYQLAQTIGSGLGPLIAAALLAAAGGGTNSGLIAGYLVLIAIISTLALLRLPETARNDLTNLPALPVEGEDKPVAPPVDA
jgi:MFS family permease